MTGLALIFKKCSKCHLRKKFLVDTPRDKLNICGDCWDWKKYPKDLNTSDTVI